MEELYKVMDDLLDLEFQIKAGMDFLKELEELYTSDPEKEETEAENLAVLMRGYLHCNVIIELKNDEFKHEDLGQLNAYVGYYKKNEMAEGNNPPVGILLCTDKGSEMVEYALSGMDNQLFVSTYMLHLPDKKKLQEFILKEMEDMGI